MIRAINFVRGWSHRHSLHYSRRLSARAGRWARHLMNSGVLAHSGVAQGEIIEWHTGHRGMVNRTAIEWFHSNSHRHVMLARRYRRAGAGKAVGYMNGRRSVVWVVQFG